MESEKQETLERKPEAVDKDKLVHNLNTKIHDLNIQLKTAMDRVSMLEQGLELKTTSTQLIKKLDQDSIEIGAQATGRIKVYGNLSDKAGFARKIADSIELLEATRAKIEKINGNGEGSEKK